MISPQRSGVDISFAIVLWGCLMFVEEQDYLLTLCNSRGGPF